MPPETETFAKGFYMKKFHVVLKNGTKISISSPKLPAMARGNLEFAGDDGRSIIAAIVLSEIVYWYEDGKASIAVAGPAGVLVLLAISILYTCIE